MEQKTGKKGTAGTTRILPQARWFQSRAWVEGDIEEGFLGFLHLQEVDPISLRGMKGVEAVETRT
jgi:hypothetical protein